MEDNSTQNGCLPTVMMDTWLKLGLLGAVGGVCVMLGTVPFGSSVLWMSSALADLRDQAQAN